jgi:hypothetical protein
MSKERLALKIWMLLSSGYFIVPYFSIDNAHLIYNGHPKHFDIPFYVQITRMTLTSCKVRK